jgi:hypothetical protein
MVPRRFAWGCACMGAALWLSSAGKGDARGQGASEAPPPAAPGSPPAAPFPGAGAMPEFLPPPAKVGESDMPLGTGLGPLQSPLETPPAAPSSPEGGAEVAPFFNYHVDPPLGFAGASSVLPSTVQVDPHFVPAEDRWRAGFPAWDRYGKGHPRTDDYPFVEGNILNPYKQNVLKGDYPIFGQNTFLNLSAGSLTIIEPRQLPTATTPFESTTNPGQKDFFGKPDQLLVSQYNSVIVELFHGNAGFKQPDWVVRLVPVFNFNYLTVEEEGIVSPDLRDGTTRARTFFTMQEWFIEKKLLDLSPDFDFLSIRAGSQFFVSDFRGFIFADTNRGVRLFGTQFSQRDQFNLVYFNQQEKDTNSFLNTFTSRKQDVFVANYYRQDFLFPGFTSEWSIHYNHDNGGFELDRNGFLVRPDPVGVPVQHELDVVYLGWAGDGHINRFNVNHAFYWALGHDSFNPLANQAQNINAQMGALELSYDYDWVRFRTSFLYYSGDRNVNSHTATGFDSILDSPNFAGGIFTYWQRQAVPLFGVNLTNRFSLEPDLRSSKFQGQSNFVNPGLYLGNWGFDVEITPKLRSINNYNLMWFAETDPLKTFIFQARVRNFIGADLSSGLEYRPLLNDNVVFLMGVATLVPGSGFDDLYNKLHNRVTPLLSSFVQMQLAF